MLEDCNLRFCSLKEEQIECYIQASKLDLNIGRLRTLTSLLIIVPHSLSVCLKIAWWAISPTRRWKGISYYLKSQIPNTIYRYRIYFGHFESIPWTTNPARPPDEISFFPQGGRTGVHTPWNSTNIGIPSRVWWGRISCDLPFKRRFSSLKSKKKSFSSKKISSCCMLVSSQHSGVARIIWKWAVFNIIIRKFFPMLQQLTLQKPGRPSSSPSSWFY